MTTKTKKLLCVAAAATVFAVVASAQMSDANQILNSTYTTLKSMSKTIINIVSILMGIVGIIMLVLAIPKYTKGDPSSADSLLKVGGGVLIATIILQIIKTTLLN